MIIIRNRAYARAGLLGNPSDGYNGKTISFISKNFWAEVVLYEWDSVDIVLAEGDRARFRTVYDLAQDVVLHGYYGGIRLVKATIKRFVEYCQHRGLPLHEQNFSVRYSTNIPRQVGLAGSSSIIVATLRCLMEFYDVEMPIEIQPTFVLSIEQEELGITAGLQDRVIQIYEGLVYMDFSKEAERTITGLTCYNYESLDASLLPPIYISYHDALSEPTEFFHNDIRGRYDRGDETVIQAMEHFADLAAQGREAIMQGDGERLGKLIDENFDTRDGIYNLPPWQAKMIQTARQCGATAKFAGSGGAIVGTYEDEAMFNEISARMADIGSKTFKPDMSA
ncbi:MAG: GHMP kinase [Chloroflexota bacterium]